MNGEIQSRKTELRRRIKAVLNGLSASQIQNKSFSIGETLFASPWWLGAAWVFCFISLPGEVDTAGILERAWRDGKQVGIPRIRGGEIVFHRYVPEREHLVVNRYGIEEPASSWPVLAPVDAPARGLLLVCPGLAFDREGRRLGRGGGFYDRFLKGLRGRPGLEFAAVGVCFREQVVDSLPAAAHDQCLDALICENRVIRVEG